MIGPRSLEGRNLREVAIGDIATILVERVRQISLNEIEERDSGDCANRHDGPSEIIPAAGARAGIMLLPALLQRAA
jgi:hypothetical protein